LSISLSLPRSPTNLAAGNFMLDLSLLSTTSPILEHASTIPGLQSTTIAPQPQEILHRARRHAILTYESPLVSISKKIWSLPWYLLSLKREDETLQVPIYETLTFPRGQKNVPRSLFLEIQSPNQDPARGGTGRAVEVYNVEVHIRAVFSGLRWWMYNHCILSFAIGTSAFWGAEVFSLALGWAALYTIFARRGPMHDLAKAEAGDDAVKKEEDDTDDLDLSDTPRSFPTYGRQPPLRYTPEVKEEDEEERSLLDTALQPLPAEAEADDESEDVVDVGGAFGAGRGMTDSGIGTSLSEGGGAGGSARRRSSKSKFR
jgi:seipin